MAASLVVRLLMGLCAVALLLASPALSQGSPPASELSANGKIVFTRNGSIWVINPDGSGAAKIGEPFTQLAAPDWSPDGTKIAFGGTGLFIMNADGSEVTQVFQGEFGVGEPAWSPDGSRIAFWAAPPPDKAIMGSGYQIHAVNVDGSNHRVLSDHGYQDDVSWSPDGSRIAFISRRGLGPFEVYTMAADGSDERLLTPAPGWNVDWSPDGSKIAFVKERERYRNTAIFLINADGTDLRELITNDPCDAGWAPNCPTRRMGPAWSPDGTQIAFWRDSPGREGGESIYVVNADGTNERRLTYHTDDLVMDSDIDPDWQPLPKQTLLAEPAASPSVTPSAGDCPQTSPSVTSTPSPLSFPDVTPSVPATPAITQSPAGTPPPASPSESAFPEDRSSATNANDVTRTPNYPPGPDKDELPKTATHLPSPSGASQAEPSASPSECEAADPGAEITAQAVGLIALGVLTAGSALALSVAAVRRRRS